MVLLQVFHPLRCSSVLISLPLAQRSSSRAWSSLAFFFGLNLQRLPMLGLPCSAHTARSGKLHTSQLCANHIYWCHVSRIGGLWPSALLFLSTNMSLASGYCRMRPSARPSMSFCPSASLNPSTTLFILPIFCLYAAQIRNTCVS